MQRKVSTLGGDREEQQKLLESHNKDTQRLINKMDANRLRMETDLQERIRRKREAKRKAKDQEVAKELQQKRKERDELERLELQRLEEEEKHKLETLQETMQEEEFAAMPEDKEEEESEEEQTEEGELQEPVNLALPLTEEQLTSVLLSTPLYHKLEQIRLLLQTQPIVHAPQGQTGTEAYIDSKDAMWVHDTVLRPVDIAAIPVRAFVVYKFGCCVIESLIAHCNHQPVSLLLADRIPPNGHHSRNAFRNSFAYDPHNKILYMRLERLDNVGEFILVLVHTLSHIKIGGFSDDSDPSFVREFYRALSICCSDLFLSRYRHSSTLSLVDRHREEDSTQTPAKVLESLFNSAHRISEKLAIIDEVLDTRVMTSIDLNGTEFSHKSIMQRLSGYSEFQVGSKLRAFLDNIEPEIRDLSDNQAQPKVPSSQAEVPTPDPAAKPRGVLSTASPDQNEASQSLTLRGRDGALPVDKGHSIRQRASTMHIDQYKKFLQAQIQDLRKKVNNLGNEYTQMTRERVKMTGRIQGLEDQLSKKTKLLKELEHGTGKYETQKQALKDVTSKLSATKANLATLEIRITACAKRLDAFKTQLEQKQSALEDHLTEEAGEKL